jgi:hypothetical protein
MIGERAAWQHIPAATPAARESGDRQSAVGLRRDQFPQFHIGPIGVCVQQGPKLPPFQVPR